MIVNDFINSADCLCRAFCPSYLSSCKLSRLFVRASVVVGVVSLHMSLGSPYCCFGLCWCTHTVQKCLKAMWSLLHQEQHSEVACRM